MPLHPLHLPRICVALSGDGMAGRAASLADTFSFFEFRLDTAPDPPEAVFHMGALLRRHPQLRVIATCRRQANGGSFHGTAADEIETLRQAIAVGAHIVDLSLETAEESAINPYALTPLRRGTGTLMLSWHDFGGTPPLAPVLNRMRAIGAGLYKIVPTATSLRDSFALLDLLEHNSAAGDLVAMSMGVPGIATRVLGPRYGSRFTFAAAANGAETAPGQVDAATLRDLYRIDAITPQTAVYAVFGKPVTSSRSPVMLNTALRHTGRDAVYLPLQTASADELFEACNRLSLSGASVTMPLKEEILPRLLAPGAGAIAPDAAKLGAANTLTRQPDGTLRGSNTDVTGIQQPLAQRMGLRDAYALIVGAGGVARAAVFALQQAGCRVSILNRTASRAAALAAETGAQALSPDQATTHHLDIVLNATPYGMAGQTDSVSWPVPFEALNCSLFFDLVYNPIETPLIRSAQSRGIPFIPGVEMFVAQGAAQFTTWTGENAPQPVMLAAVLSSLASSKRT